MFGLGVWELALVLAIVILIFGAKSLPALGEGLGRTLKELRSLGKGSSPPSPSGPAEDKETGSKSLADQVLPELREVRDLKSKADKVRRWGRWLRLR